MTRFNTVYFSTLMLTLSCVATPPGERQFGASYNEYGAGSIAGGSVIHITGDHPIVNPHLNGFEEFQAYQTEREKEAAATPCGCFKFLADWIKKRVVKSRLK